MNCHTSCFFCDNPLSKRHEHDHFGHAKRHGGESTVCICINCHDLKDRTPLAKWDSSTAITAFNGLFLKANTVERIILAKLVDLWSDATSAIKEGK